MAFRGLQKTLTYQQINDAPPDKVFPLLCPVREKEWVPGWEYTMIHSVSGLVERGCVFTTPHHGASETVWLVTAHDTSNHTVEFVRVTPGEHVVKINIALYDNGNGTTSADISYQFTALCESRNAWLENEADQDFEKMMTGWEEAINHYLATGRKLDP